MLIEKEPFKEALFGRDSIVFLIIIVIVETVAIYISQVRKANK